VEIKSSATVEESDLRGLRKLARLAEADFKMGVLLYDGDETLPPGDNIWAAPLSTLWGGVIFLTQAWTVCLITPNPNPNPNPAFAHTAHQTPLQPRVHTKQTSQRAAKPGSRANC
jgi:hypothetical protein